MGQNKNIRQGKGAFTFKENGNTYIGYWENDKKSNNKVNTKSEMAQPNSDQKTEREETK